MKPLVYVAGPYTKPDPIENTHTAIHIAETLYETGLVVPIIPHLTAFWHLVSPHPYQYWIDYDLLVMTGCDAVYRFPGESSGADGEVEWAAKEGQPVFYEQQDLLAWAAARMGVSL